MFKKKKIVRMYMMLKVKAVSTRPIERRIITVSSFSIITFLQTTTEYTYDKGWSRKKQPKVPSFNAYLIYS